MFGVATDEQWEKMKKFIKSDKYTKDDFFVFETLATGDREIPNRYKKINRSALEVMEQDAKKGVSLMLNHNEGQLGVQSIPIGKVFDGRIGNGTQPGENNALYLTQYILKDDSKVDGYSKNDIINLIESGIAEDTSVCFTIPFETAKCSICHRPFYGSECRHYAGEKYVVNEETGEQRTCVMEINAPEYSSMEHNGNAMLVENSIVFDGAYPNAMIQQSSNGEVIETNNGKYTVLNENCKTEKTELDDVQNFTIFATSKDLKLMYKPFGKGGKVMDKETEVLSKEETLKETLTKEDVKDEKEVEDVVDTEQDKKEVETEETPKVETKVEIQEQMSITKKDILEAFGNENIDKETLLKLAKEGLEYRNNVIEEALKSGIKSMGNDFNKEAFKKSFENMSTEDILKNKETFDKSVLEKFGNHRVSKASVDNKDIEIVPDIDLSTLKTRLY